MSREALIEMAQHSLAHAKAGTIDQTIDVLEVPAHHYYEPTRWEQEVTQVFRRLPLMLAVTDEVRNPGDYKAMTVAQVPLMIVRQQDGSVRAFVNSCSHRGAQIVTEAKGNAKRFTCPYHAWTYDQGGELVSIYAEKDFGTIDKSCNGLQRLPVLERAGLIWVCLDPKSDLDIEKYLCGYDHLLAHFGFESWRLFDQRRLEGPNWKIAYDGYLDLYHLPILHKDTFGSQMSNQALYTAWGPHQRVSSPDRNFEHLEGKSDEHWKTEHLVAGVWTIFPHISIASFDGGGGRGVMISQLFPGDTPEQSYTVQNYLMESWPTDETMLKAARDQFKLLEYVVQEEDYATGILQQKALSSGLKETVMFGRNEGGGQHFHGWVDRLLKTEDKDLAALFDGHN